MPSRGAVRLRSITRSGRRRPAGAEAGFFELRAQRVASFEKDYLASMLRTHQGDVAAAAKAAQVPRGTYYRLMKNHGLKAADFRDRD